MRIVTWNVNSIRIRIDRLVAWLAERQPDVLCLQELKVADDEFPFAAIAAAGYHAAIHGQKTYNGVAVLTRTPAEVVARGLGDGVDDPQARLIDVRLAPPAGGPAVRVLSVYVPNGSEPSSDKYAYKLRWLARLRDYLQRHADPNELLAVCGDYNIAPEPIDIRHLAQWSGTVLHNPEVRAAWDALADWGLQDAFRRVCPDAGLYSWWDYRNLGFQKNDGLRIDHVLATAPLAATATGGWIDRPQRKGDKPSDHVPLGVDFAVAGWDVPKT